MLLQWESGKVSCLGWRKYVFVIPLMFLSLLLSSSILEPEFTIFPSFLLRNCKSGSLKWTSMSNLDEKLIKLTWKYSDHHPPPTSSTHLLENGREVQSHLISWSLRLQITYEKSHTWRNNFLTKCFLNSITHVCTTADCYPLLTICPTCCPRHAPDDVIIHCGFPHDFPKTIPKFPRLVT